MKTQHFQTAAIMCSLFLVSQFFGLYITEQYKGGEVPYGIETPEPESYSPATVIISIIVATVVLYLMLKYKLDLFVKIWYITAITVCSSVTLSLFVGEIFGLILAFVIALIKLKEKDLYFHNITEMLVYSGLVVIFSPMFDVITGLIVLAGISIYDIIAVLGTRHMITFAKKQSKMGFFPGFIVKYKKDVSILGGGDVGFTLFFATIVSRASNFVDGIYVILGSLAGLLIILIYGKKKKFYPAMPFLTAGMVVAYIISLMV